MRLIVSETEQTDDYMTDHYPEMRSIMGDGSNNSKRPRSCEEEVEDSKSDTAAGLAHFVDFLSQLDLKKK